jgi:hypothetical protein
MASFVPELRSRDFEIVNVTMGQASDFKIAAAFF